MEDFWHSIKKYFCELCHQNVKKLFYIGMSKTTKTMSSIQKNNRNNKYIDQEKNENMHPRKHLIRIKQHLI